ncbi:alkaline phosphatase family protein [Marinilabiliaceae bacterium JC017]|nr:alkaline phosphatase family protein [Marinilabiliaceae bacterium JC017]
MKEKWIFCVVFVWLLSSLSGFSQRQIPSQQPKLVLFLMVDELSSQQLMVYRDKFKEDGFNRLMQGGAFAPNASYTSGSNYKGSTLATFYTGAYPSTHGIISDQWYDPMLKKQVAALEGPMAENGETSQAPSGKYMMSTTISEELYKLYVDSSLIASVGFSGNNQAWAFGHVNKPYYWLDAVSGRFISPADSSGNGIPTWVNNFNDKAFPELYSEREWGPMYDLQSYHEFNYYKKDLKKEHSFLYSLGKDKGLEGYGLVCHSPYGNKMVRDFAVSLIMEERFGKDDHPDFLTVNFSAKPGVRPKAGPYDTETEDMLLRLDTEIADLLGFLDEYMGLENVLVVTTGVNQPQDQGDNSHDTGNGVFNGRKAASLLNLYLMAVHGQGKWVKSYHDGQIYLNHDLLEKSDLDIQDIERKAADFLLQVQGVAYAVPASDIMRAPADLPVLQSLKRAYHPKRSGDVLLALEPGWKEELESGAVVAKYWSKKRVPLIFYGWKINRQRVMRALDMVDVAPTICSFLEIPFPSGCEGEPIVELLP